MVQMQRERKAKSGHRQGHAVRSQELVLITPEIIDILKGDFLNSRSGFLWRRTKGEPNGNGVTK